MSVTEVDSSEQASELSLDEIIAELDRDCRRNLPERALRAAQQRRDEIKPRLIELLQRATAAVRAGEDVETDGHLFALYLLTEFRAVEALPTILEAISLPDDGPFELFGDAITEALSRVLAALASDSIDIIDGLIANRSLNEYVRWAAAETYTYLVRDGRMTRDQAVERLRGHLRSAITNRDREITGFLIVGLDDFAPQEALGEIEEAYRQRLVDEMLIRMKDVRRGIVEGDARVRDSLERCRTTGIANSVEELSSWDSFQEPGPEPVIPRPLLADRELDPSIPVSRELDDEPWDSDEPIRHTEPRVGRNALCPCGSGRKFKKCCGKS